MAHDAGQSGPAAAPQAPNAPDATPPGLTRLFLAGDVMLGRGIDQILPHPGDPRLYEPWLHSALGYVDLAERANGAIARPADFAYPWGVALAELQRRRPEARIVNLETAVTVVDQPWPKAINYRMHPDNVGCLHAAGIDACALANNHVLDWGRDGLAETLAVLARAGFAVAGAGRDAAQAAAPAVLALRGGRRLLLFAAATDDCGVPEDWGAGAMQAGVWRLPSLAGATVAAIGEAIRVQRRAGDLVLVSIHWGGNWGYEVPAAQRDFAHALIDEAGVDLIHGHSAHHVKAIEVHRRRLILYGCGDLIDDYEGIGDYAAFRGDLGLLYFPALHADGRLAALDLVPTRLHRFRLESPGAEDRCWLLRRLQRECGRFATAMAEAADGSFALRDV